MIKYEITVYTYKRSDGSRFREVEILEKGTCRIIGKRFEELKR